MKKNNFTLIVLATLAMTQYATASEQSDIFFQTDFTTTAPQHPSSNIVLGSDLRKDVAVDENIQSELTLAYFLTDNINIEVLATTPFTHNIDVSEPLSTSSQLSEVTHLSSTLAVNNYFEHASSKFAQYISADINNTTFFEEEFISVNNFVGLDDLSLVNSFGLDSQEGADYVLNDKWFVNGSTRWVNIDTEASFKLSGGEAAVEIIKIAPWVHSTTLSFHF